MESSNNLLETLPEHQQLQVYELMGIANIEDGNVAAQIYIESNFDINRAVQRWLDRQSGAMHPEPMYTQEPLIENPRPAQNQQQRQQRSAESELHTQYRRHLQRKTREEEEKGLGDSLRQGVTSVVSGFKNIWNSFVPIAIRGETAGGEQFLSYFRRDYPNLMNELKFNTGTFEENVEQANAVKRPLLVFVHVDGNTFKNIPNIIFKNKKLVDLMNNKFRLLGLLLNTEESQKLTKYLETKDCPCLAVFRVNLLDETVLVEFIPLTNESNPDEVFERLQNIERSFFVILADEEKIKQDTKRSITQQQIRSLQMNSPFFYANAGQNDQMFSFFGANPHQQQQQRPQMSTEEQQRLEEARILRQIQEEEFKEVERKILEQQTKQVEEEKNQKEKEENERIAREKREEEERIKEQQKALHKKLKTEVLPPEPEEGAPDAVLFIFRLPDGDRLERRFRNTDKVQSLYDFVDTKDITFDSSTVRYDLMQPRPFLCLEDREKSIGEYFEGSNHEVIHVRELTA